MGIGDSDLIAVIPPQTTFGVFSKIKGEAPSKVMPGEVPRWRGELMQRWSKEKLRAAKLKRWHRPLNQSNGGVTLSGAEAMPPEVKVKLSRAWLHLPHFLTVIRALQGNVKAEQNEG